MTRKLASPCAQAGCPAVAVRHGRCAGHQRLDTRPPIYQRPGYGPAWAAIRAVVLRQEPSCRKCGAPSTRVDHIVPLRLGGTHDRSNLQGLCERCHNRKTGHEVPKG
jgi:5-methylcytosine-specific restriction protein A